MWMRHAAAIRAYLGACVFLLFLAESLCAQAPLRLGVEFQVDTYTSSYQRLPAVSRASDGRFVIAWQSVDGSASAVFARRYDAAGVPVGAEFRVNSFTLAEQSRPDVAIDDNGRFVVVWESYLQDGSEFGIFARRFDATGTPLAVEFRVNTRTAGLQEDAAVAVDVDGDFVVAWDSDGQDGDYTGIFSQRFDSSGTRRGVEFQVNTFTTDGQSRADVALDDDGDFVVVWKSNSQDGSAEGIFAKRFTSAGAAGAETLVNAYTVGSQFQPEVGMDADGEFVVSWHSLGGVTARRFNVLGTPEGGEIQVNSLTSGNQTEAEIDVAGSGAFVVTWQSASGDDSEIFAREFDSTGSPRSVEILVNTYTSAQQTVPAVAVSGNGGFVVAWESDTQDGDSRGVFAQRFTPGAVLDIDGNGDVAALTDGLLVLRFMFGFIGTTLTNGAVDTVDCTRCDAAAILPYLQGLV